MVYWVIMNIANFSMSYIDKYQFGMEVLFHDMS